MKRATFRSLSVENLEEKIVLSSVSVVHALSHVQPGEIHLLKTGKNQAPKAFVEGTSSFQQFGAVTMNGGSAYIKPFGNVTVADGSFGFEDEFNNKGKMIFSGADGSVDLQDKNGNDLAELNFTASTPASQITFGPSTKLRFTLQRWLFSPGSFGTMYLGKVISSGTAKLSFPNGVGSVGGAPVEYLITFAKGH